MSGVASAKSSASLKYNFMENVDVSEIKATERELRYFLASLPIKLGSANAFNLRANVDMACYYALCGKGKFTEEVFGVGNKQNSMVPESLDWDPIQVDPHLKFSGSSSQKYSHAKSQACARILKDGEFLFRCSDCFYDSSCILCEDCFNSADHVGHKVLKYNAMGGGMCDCGDESAFLRKLNCACLQDPDGALLSPDITSRLYMVLSVILNYIVDVGNITILDLPEVATYIEEIKSSETLPVIFERCTLPEAKYGPGDVLEDEEDIEWDLVVMRNESQVPTSARDEIAKYKNSILDKRIDLLEELRDYAKPTVIASTDLLAMFTQQEALSMFAVLTQIRPSRDSMREKIVYFLFKWIEDLMCCEWNFSLKTLSKAVAADILLDKPEDCSQVDALRDFGLEECTTFLPDITIKNLYEGGTLFYKPNTSRENYSSVPMENFSYEFKSDHCDMVLRLLTYEVRFPGNIRERLDNLLIQSLMHDQQCKDQFAFSFLRAYPTLLYLLAIADGNALDSCLLTISVQVFMCPPTNNSVLQSDYVCNLIVPVINLVESFFSGMNSFGYLNIKDILNSAHLDPKVSKRYVAMSRGMDTIYRVFTKNDSKNMLNLLFRRQTLIAFLAYLSLFQSAGEIKREVGNHIEQENFHAFEFLIKVCTTALILVKSVNKAKELEPKLAEDALQVIMAMTNRKSNKLWLTEFPVSQIPASFINPLQFLICTVARRIEISLVLKHIDINRNLWKGIYDYSLRSIILASQVKIGTWVRNGDLVSRISSLYFSKQFADMSYYSDFHLMQIAALTEEPDVFIDYLLKRWEFLSWMLNEGSYKDTVYEDKFGFACEQFIIFIYNLLVERYFFDHNDAEEDATYLISKSLVYRLAEGPQSFSTLWRAMKRQKVTIETFTDILRNIADYFPPQGLTDSGVYRLKPKLLEGVDLIGLFLDSGLSQSTLLLLIESIAKLKGVDPAKICLVPEIHPCKNAYVNSHLGDFLRTRLFSKFAYKLLQVGLDEKEESILIPLLHLIHALLVDDERIHGKEHINKYFLQYPICNVLLSIADATISPTVSSKAEFVLDTLISKDDNILQSLSLCFGEMHIKNYRDKKRDATDKKRKRSKDAVEARKAKILLKFAKQRQTFMEHNSIGDDGKGSDDKLYKNKCVACGETETIKKTACLPFALSEQAIDWYIPSKGPFFQFAFKDYWDEPGPDAIYRFNALARASKKQSTFPKSRKKPLELPYTCLHYIHKKCCVTRVQDEKFVCPLCNQKFGKILPSYYHKDDIFIPTKWLEGEPKNPKYFDLCAKLSVTKNDEILRSILHNDFFDNDQLKTDIEMPTYDPFGLHKPDAITVFDHMKKISNLIAHSIKSHEIAARLDGMVGMSNFVESFPFSAISLCRSLVQNRVLLFNITRTETSTMKFEECAKKYWSFSELGDDHFADTIDTFFLTNETLQTHIRAGFARMIIDSLNKLQKNCVPFTLETGDEVPEDIIEGVASALYYVTHDFNITDQQAGFIYQAIQKIVIPFLRQCVMFKHVLTCCKTGENEYLCLEDFEELHEYNDQWSTSKYISVLCKCLNIPDLDEILKSMGNLDSYERQVMEDYSEYAPSKSGEGLIAYPNVQKMIQLPKSYLEVRSSDPTPYKSSFICLHCSETLSLNEKTMHSRRCIETGIFFCLSVNTIYAEMDGIFEVHLPGPYMTEHGEVKLDDIPGEAELNDKRYLYLNKIWLNNELFGVMSRSVNHYGHYLRRVNLAIEEEVDQDDEQEIEDEDYDLIMDMGPDFLD